MNPTTTDHPTTTVEQQAAALVAKLHACGVRFKRDERGHARAFHAAHLLSPGELALLVACPGAVTAAVLLADIPLPVPKKPKPKGKKP